MSRKPQYEEVHIDISMPQMHRLAKGETVHVKHHQLFRGHPIILHKKKVRHIGRAHEAKRGVRLSISPDEFEHNHLYGSGKFLDALRNAGQWLKKNIIDTDIYQKNIKPVVRQVVDQGVNALQGMASSKNPILGQVVGDVARAAADKVGSATNAYGIRHGRKRYGGTLLQGPERGTALNPALPMSDQSKPNYQLDTGEPPMTLHRPTKAVMVHKAVKRGPKQHLQKGSAEAMAWSEKMRAARAAKRGQRAGGIYAPGY